MGEEFVAERMKRRRGSIWPIHQTFYIQVMLFHARSSAAALAEIAVACEKDSEILKPADGRVVLNALQGLLLHAGALSRFLWPARNGHEARGEELRQALKVTDESPLRDRSLRNAMEHFDEQLDLYLCRDLSGYVFPEFVGPLEPKGQVPEHYFRGFDPGRNIFEMLGQQYDIQPIAAEVLRILELLTHLDKEGRF